MCFAFRACGLITLIAVSATLTSCSDFGEAGMAVPATAPLDTSLRLESAPAPAPAAIESISPEEELAAPEVSSEDSDGDTAEAFLGIWQLYDHGTRTIIVNPDGTASMHIELDFFAALAYGPKMDMDLTWSVDDGVLSYAIVHGEPVDSVDRVINDYGRERTYRVIELSDDSLQLEDLAFPGTFYDWTRIGDRG